METVINVGAITLCLLFGSVLTLSKFPRLIVVMFDGFGHELFHDNLHLTKHLSFMYNQGVRLSEGTIPVFPTVTYPNVFSIATGLYPESHGIIWNEMTEENYHRVEKFVIWSESDEDSSWWDNGLNMPIWTLNEIRNGTYTAHSGGMMWAGTGASYRNRKITYYEPFSRDTFWYDRVDTVMDWLTDESQPANCVFVYFEEPDEEGHRYGPNSPQVRHQISRVDEIVGYLMNQIKRNKMEEVANVMMVSDHGMAELLVENLIHIETLTPSTYYSARRSSGMWSIDPYLGYFDQVYDALVRGSEKHNFNVWKKHLLPRNLHYTSNDRIQPIILIAQPGYALSGSLNVTMDATDSYSYHLGGHGYNGSSESMRGLFLAIGPAFKKNFTLNTSIEHVDLYPLMCKILELKPGANNGSFDKVSHLLADLAPNISKTINSVCNAEIRCVVKNWNSAQNNVGLYVVILLSFITLNKVIY